MINLLITSINWRSQILKDFKEGLKKIHANNKIITVEMDSLSSGIYFADANYMLPAYTEENYLQELEKVCQTENINYILPQTDRDCNFMATHKSFIEAWGLTILMPDEDVVTLLNDKLKAQTFFEKQGFLIPKNYPIDQLQAITNYPVIIKPRKDSGSAHVYIAHDQEELTAFIKRVPHPVVEEYIDGVEYTVDGVTNEDGSLIGLVPRKRLMVKAGISIKGVTVNHPEIITLSKKIAQSVKLKGFFCIQFMERNDKLYLLEVNSRIGSGFVLSLQAGLDISDIFSAYDKKSNLIYPDGFFEENVYMMQYLCPVIKRQNELL
ncbi:MAG: ATP-grasp domain-containing protein [bacterium]|nr:ATP-grasp domain-containing protein [bacterium]MBU1918036.1 ATP-grasp domain-containing protein [bacterium]